MVLTYACQGVNFPVMGKIRSGVSDRNFRVLVRQRRLGFHSMIGAGIRQAQIARWFGISRQAVNQAIRRDGKVT